MPKKQRRFKSEQAILKAIDTMEARRQRCLEQADTLEISLKTLREEEFPSHDDFVSELNHRRKIANASRRSAARAASKKVELGKALSAYRTMLLPMPLNEDTSVVL